MKCKTVIQGIAALLTAAAVFPSLQQLSAEAKTEYQLIGYFGDVTLDRKVDAEDVSALVRHLTAAEPLTEESAYHYADIDKNGDVTAVDLALLKRLLLSGAEPEGEYEEIEVPDPQLVPPPISAVNPTMPCVGTAHVLMFAVSFPDCQFTEGYTTEQIWEMSFGPENKSSRSYPLESISAYYERASYGRLHIEGDVYQYTARYGIANYQNPTEYTSYDGTDRLLDEIMTALDDEIDFRKYDVNGDYTMDTVILALPGDAGTEHWWPCSGGYYGYKRFDGVKAGNVCYGGWALSDRRGFNSTWTHELGHAMGLPDYYKYVNTENGYYGMNGDAGWEMMDDAYGDMSAFSKLMYGWYTDEEVMLYQGGTQTFRLKCSQDAPGCILIPRGDLNGYHSEYFLVEYIKHTENNALSSWWFGSGIRVLHCNAELWDGYWGPELKWNNYGQMYDDSNMKQRVLRLANEEEGGDLIGENTVIDSQLSGFRWYDDSGWQTVDPGVVITVGPLEDDAYTITISQK
ncbi:MAG: hypothetical protein IK107_05355 [Oscillospiraceae bacterium]|nr:hypothetical protein [Oscillospiraceae bacterium]